MGHSNLGNYFNTNFSLWEHHRWSIDVIEAMMPWERYVYIDLLQAYAREEKQRQEEIARAQKAEMESHMRRARGNRTR